MHPVILIIEDDISTQTYLKNLLSEQGYLVRCVEKGADGLELLAEVIPDLVLLDLQLPDIQGESVCIQIKKQFSDMPVIMLTSKDSLEAKVQGLGMGADDYVTKPFDAEELLARIRARLRSQSSTNPVIKVGDLELDTQKIEVKRDGKTIKLTPREFQLLQYLLQNTGKVLSREMILNKIWAYSFEVESRVVDVYMGYLRKKIDRGYSQKLIHSIRGFGYTVKE